MSRGLSKLQRTILKELDMKPLSFHQIADINWKHKVAERPDKDTLAGLRSLAVTKVQDERNYSDIYRTMRSLVKHRLAGEILNVRPKIWVRVHEENGELKAGTSPALHFARKPLRLRVGEDIYELDGERDQVGH